MSGSDEQTQERRTSWRWIKLVFTIFLLLVAGCIAWYWLWGNRKAQNLWAELAALKAAGHPITAADLAQKSVPDERNAALLLRRAADLIDPASEAWQAYDRMEFPRLGSRLPLRDDEREILRRVVEQNKEVFALVGRARQLTEFDWQIDCSAGPLNVDFKPFSAQRRLANLLQAAAMIAHEDGDDATAIERAEQVGFISHAVGTAPNLITALISSGIASMQVKLLDEMSPSLRIGDDSTSVSPQRLRALINDLLKNDAQRELMRRGLIAERAFQQDMMQALMEGRGGNPLAPGASGPGQQPGGSALAGVVLGPVMRENALLMLRHMNKVIESLDSADWPSFEARFQSIEAQLRRSPYRYRYASLMLPALDRAVLVNYRVLTDRHLTAAALACRWYAVEHDGRPPASLDELVPKYLPHVALDLLAGAGKTIGYVPDADRPRVYHVGENGKDDSGREPDPLASERENKGLSDEVVHLKHQPRPTTGPADEE